MKEEYVTDLSALKVIVKPRFPGIIRSLSKFIMRYGIVPFVKILGKFLGFGFGKNGVKRYPEYFIKLKDGTKLATDVYVPKRVFKKKSKFRTHFHLSFYRWLYFCNKNDKY